MKDYLSIYIKWAAFFKINQSIRSEMYDTFHEEIKKGIEAIAKIASEEIAQTIPENIYQKMQATLEAQLTVLIVSGYVLYLIENKIDPEKNNLRDREETDAVGSEWMQAYQKDQLDTFLQTIDPILAMFMYQQSSDRLDHFFATASELMNTEYKNVSQLEKVVHWAINQGYLFGYIEEKLQKE